MHQILRNCIKAPIPEIFSAWDALSAAVSAHLAEQPAIAAESFRRADCPVVWEWLDSTWSFPRKNVVLPEPPGDSVVVGMDARDPDRNISRTVRAAVLARDGYRCRYCGIPVIDASIRDLAHRLYPGAVPWVSGKKREQHAGFQCCWLQFDHVEPHSHGGRSTVENVVISCALCNYGKDGYTLRQLSLEDPRLRAPEPLSYDGLVRLRNHSKKLASGPSVATTPTPKPQRLPGPAATFFFPEARISKGYLYTPPIEGIARWFKLDANACATLGVRNGQSGCLLTVDPKVVARRGIDVAAFLDIGDADVEPTKPGDPRSYG